MRLSSPRLETMFLGNRFLNSYQVADRFLATLDGRPLSIQGGTTSAAEKVPSNSMRLSNHPGETATVIGTSASKEYRLQRQTVPFASIRLAPSAHARGTSSHG